MSIIRAIKHRLGLSVTPANNFVLDASADNGTMKLARESGQDIMTVDAAGKVAFPQMAQSLVSGNGYVKLPGGLILQWKQGSTDAAGGLAATLPIQFPTGHLLSVATHAGAPNAAGVRAASVETIVANQTVVCWSSVAAAGQFINVFSLGY
jgi:hypothetical protein